MKINQTLTPKVNNNIDRNKQDVQFKGAAEVASIALRYLETNQAVGANLVDLGSMVIPRTTVDFINRGPAAGTETMRREASGTANHSLIGVYGAGAGLALSQIFNNRYGIKANKLFADNSTVDILGHFWKENNGNLDKYLEEISDNITTHTGNEWRSLDNEAKSKFKHIMKSEIENVDVKKAYNKDAQKLLKSAIIRATGSENDFKLAGFGNKKAESSLSVLMDNIYGVTKTFMSDKVKTVFENAKGIDDNAFLKGIKRLNISRSALGLGIGAAIGMSIQPLNIYLTKKKTGSDGFVGVEGREKDNSAGFKLMKLGAAGAFITGVLGSIGKLKELPKNLQFRGVLPTISQFKFIYGMTIMSRFLVARDKDELRESVVKDTLGFANWLILGNFVSKLTAEKLDKDLIKSADLEENAGRFTKFIKSGMRTRDEIVQSALKELNISNIGADGKALNFKAMMKELTNAAKDSNAAKAQIAKIAKTKVGKLNIAQAAGYIYSGVVLGWGLPKLNIWMTNRSEAKRQSKLAEAKAKVHEPEAPTYAAKIAANQARDAMLTPENLAFLSKHM